MAGRVTVWTVGIGYLPSGNPYPQSSFEVVCDRRPTFDEVSALWNERATGCPLKDGGRAACHRREWHVASLERRLVASIES